MGYFNAAYILILGSLLLTDAYLKSYSFKYFYYSKNKFSQRSFVALLEDRLEAETFSGEIYQDRQMVVDGDYMVPGKVASKWNKSAEELRKWLYNMAIKFHNTKNRRNGPSMDTHKVIIKAQKKG